MQAGAGGVERELADRDAHAERAEIAEAEDALAVGDDDHAHINDRPVAEDFGDAALVLDADEQAARAAEDGAILQAGLADGRRVDDGNHLLGVLLHEAVEERLVAILEGGEENVLLQRVGLAAEVAEGADELLLDRHHLRRQETTEAERVAFGFGERRALVEQGVIHDRVSMGEDRTTVGVDSG